MRKLEQLLKKMKIGITRITRITRITSLTVLTLAALLICLNLQTITPNGEKRHISQTLDPGGTSQYLLSQTLDMIPVSSDTVQSNQEFSLAVIATEIDSDEVLVKVTYDPSKAELISVYDHTGAKEVSITGETPIPEIYIIENKPGEISYSRLVPKTSEESWSGVLNTLKFKAKTDAPNVSYRIYQETSGGDSREIYTLTLRPNAHSIIADGTNGQKIFIENASSESGEKNFEIEVHLLRGNSGAQTAVFTQKRNGVMIQITTATQDFSQSPTLSVTIDVNPGDEIQVYLTDGLPNAQDQNPNMLTR